MADVFVAALLAGDTQAAPLCFALFQGRPEKRGRTRDIPQITRDIRVLCELADGYWTESTKKKERTVGRIESVQEQVSQQTLS